MPRQLFRTGHVSLPLAGIHTTPSHPVQQQHIADCPFMYWPDGKPCESVNMYFLDIASSSTGGSLKTYASELSHIVRYCGERQLSIVDLRDDHIFEFSKKLQNDASEKYASARARNNNTVRTVLRRTLIFLMWYQSKLVPLLRTPLVGEASKSPQIIISFKKNRHKKNIWSESAVFHAAMPCSESKEPKHPIGHTVIEDIERSIDALCLMRQPSASWSSVPLKIAASHEYIRSRRHFMIWLMKRTGLRAAEMVDMNVKKHSDILHIHRLYIPTRKRRREIIPERIFPVTLRDALIFQRYLTSRQAFIQSLCDEKYYYPVPDAMFLGTDGKAIQKTSLERDFARLVSFAGYTDVQVCMSMFRHRFITIEVVVHLREFMSGSGKSGKMMTSDDYESILKRVSAKTGHASVQSLWHYIDLAWREMDVWGNVDKALSRVRATDCLHEDLQALLYDVVAQKEVLPDTQQMLNDIISRLQSILADSVQNNLKDEDRGN
ncbi:hypothetical protein ACVOPT_004371 [Enterobacter hormaechei]